MFTSCSSRRARLTAACAEAAAIWAVGKYSDDERMEEESTREDDDAGDVMALGTDEPGTAAPDSCRIGRPTPTATPELTFTTSLPLIVASLPPLAAAAPVTRPVGDAWEKSALERAGGRAATASDTDRGTAVATALDTDCDTAVATAWEFFAVGAVDGITAAVDETGAAASMAPETAFFAVGVTFTTGAAVDAIDEPKA